MPPSIPPSSAAFSSIAAAFTGASAQASQAISPKKPTLPKPLNSLSHAIHNPNTVAPIDVESILKTTIAIIINRFNKKRLLVNPDDGSILSDILSIDPKFRSIICFNPSNLTQKHEYYLSDVGYWLSYESRTHYICPGQTCVWPKPKFA